MSDSFKRLSVSEIQDAYAVTGLKPCVFRMHEDGRACGLGVLAVQRGIETKARMSLHVGRDLGLTESYTAGFYRGFDGEFPSDAIRKCYALAQFNAGFIDGCEARKAVFGNAVVECEEQTAGVL